jgi:hypothetical protein
MPLVAAAKSRPDRIGPAIAVEETAHRTNTVTARRSCGTAALSRPPGASLLNLNRLPETPKAGPHRYAVHHSVPSVRYSPAAGGPETI